jgi:indolepyruvate ferredoxin oxidoreductase
VQSNCVAVVPLETDRGRKRRIDQSACNKDYSCEKGFCPSFVSVVGGSLRKKEGALAGGDGAARLEAMVAALPPPPPHVWTGPYDLLVTGVGGTGVVTVGAVIAMAAHLEAKSASVLDFMGFAQKGGSVLSFVRVADRADRLHQVRIDAQQADAVLACDLVVAASPEALSTVRRGRTRVLANLHGTPVAESIANPDADLRTPALLEKLRFATGASGGSDRVETMDAQALAEAFLGDSIVANIVALGFAWQRGLVPVGLAAMRRAIELNGVAVPQNLAAFSLGRLAAGDAEGCRTLLHAPEAAVREETVAEAVDREARWLESYQDRAYAARFRRVVERVEAREREVAADPAGRTARAAADARRGAHPRQAHGLQGRVRGRPTARRWHLRARARRHVRRRAAHRVPHGTTGPREAEGRRRRQAAAEGPSRALDVARAAPAAPRQAPARHAVRSVRPHGGAQAGAAARSRLRGAGRRAPDQG